MRGGGCEMSYVDIPGFSVASSKIENSTETIDGLNVGPQRATINKRCTAGGENKLMHAMT